MLGGFLGLIDNNINAKKIFLSTSRLLNSGIAKTVTPWYVTFPRC